MRNKNLKQKVINLSVKHKLSHLGSCLTAVDLIEAIYKARKPGDRFVLSSGHAGLALYVVLEAKYGVSAENLLTDHGIHPDVRTKYIDCATGSLGSGLSIAVGMALADRTKRIYCLISDGECSEGSVWEALRVRQEKSLENLVVIVNANGYGAYKKINLRVLRQQLSPFFSKGLYQMAGTLHKRLSSRLTEDSGFFMVTDYRDYPFLDGISAHYKILKDIKRL